MNRTWQSAFYVSTSKIQNKKGEIKKAQNEEKKRKKQHIIIIKIPLFTGVIACKMQTNKKLN